MSDQDNGGVPQKQESPAERHQRFLRGRQKHSTEELRKKYPWDYVAWYPDGSAIYDSDPDFDTLCARIDASPEKDVWFVIEDYAPQAKSFGQEGFVERDDMPSWRKHIWLGKHLFHENYAKNIGWVTEKYLYHHVAWLPDGSGIRDADKDRKALWQRIRRTPDDNPYWYLITYITDEAFI